MYILFKAEFSWGDFVMKKYATGLIIFIIFMILTACQQQAQGVVVETDFGDITEDELNDALQERYGKQMLEELVMMKILGEKHDVSDEQVNDELEKLKENLGMQFDIILQQEGLADEEAFKDVIYLGLLQEAAALDGVEVSDEQLKEAYEQKTKEIRAQHILVQNKNTADELTEKLEKGEDFAELAKAYSEDTVSAGDGGDLGYFSPGTMVSPFEDAAFSLEKGGISEPVQTNYGYHIIKVNDIREKDEDIGTFEDIKEDLRDEILANTINAVETQTKIEAEIKNSIVIKDDTYKSLFENSPEVTEASK